MSRPVRILSDLHFADGASRIVALSQLRPLLDGVQQVIVNGDAYDSQVTHDATAVHEELMSFFREYAANSRFITGNHDPDISPLHELSLVGGRVWLTHGDVFFDNVAPWSRILPELRRRVAHHSAHYSAAELAQIETKLRIFRQVCLKLPRHHDVEDRRFFPRFRRLVNALFPPTQAIAILKVWRDTPRLARELAAQQRPAARFVLLGHTHRPGIWTHRDGRVVINTGSFCLPGNPYAADITPNSVVVRSVVQRQGLFHLGEKLRELPLVGEK